VTLGTGRVTNGIAIVTALCWVVALLPGGSSAVGTWAGFIPGRIGGEVVVAGALPVWLTPLSATLIHGDLFHLGFNMLMLIWCGRQVESAVGGWLLALLYIVGAFAAAAAEWALNPASAVMVIGASGAISAVLAVYALVFSEQKIRPFAGLPLHVVRALWLGVAWIAIQALIGFAMNSGLGGIAIGAHAGGFVVGLVLARPLLRWRYRQRGERPN
jgi:membrane associated rhomboid family serine protease